MKKTMSTFYLNRLLFGVEVSRVKEVVPYQEATRVPLAAAAVQGLMNLRGQIVTALDLRRRLGFPDCASDQRPVNLVMRDGEDLVSFLVDEMGDIVEVEEGAFEPLPPTLQGEARQFIQAVCKLQDRFLLILDDDKALNGTF